MVGELEHDAAHSETEIKIAGTVALKLRDRIFNTMSKVFADSILQGKVAFVTGGATGITGGIARAFFEHGAKLAITSRKEENLVAKKQYIEEKGGECLTDV